jgi:hypothetical protein
MKNKIQSLNEQRERMKTLYEFNFNYDKKLLNEDENERETFKFKETFPDNLAYPIKPGVTFNTINDIKLNELTPEFYDFITKLNLSISKGAKIDNVQIQSGASSEGATNQIPTGYSQELVNKSYYDNGKVTYDNKVIALNRGKAIKGLIEKFVTPLKGKISDPNPNLNEKEVRVTIPSGVLFNFKENPKFSREYRTPTKQFSDASVIKVNKCETPIKASGSAGILPNYLADRIVIDFDVNYAGEIIFKGDSYVIPDRFVIKRNKLGGKEDLIKDSGYITSLSSGDPDFTSLSKQVKTITGMDLQGGVNGFTHTINKESGYNYFIDIYAPFGGTYWTANLECSTQPELKTPTPKSEFKDGEGQIYYVDLKTGKHSDKKEGNFQELSHEGDFKNGKFFSGRKYVYDNDGILEKIEVWENGKFARLGTIE